MKTSFPHMGCVTGYKKLLEKLGHEVIILTSRKKEWYGNAERVTRDWLEKRRLPFDEIVAEIPMEDKGAYCREHGISVLVDDDVEACKNAERHGVAAVLAVGRHNLNRAKEVRYAAANWEQIDAAVRRIIDLKTV